MSHGVTQAAAYDLPVFPWQRAPEQDGAKARHPVIVVGGGLSGLTCATDLALRGVPVVLLDEDDTVGVRGASSRGICYAERSLDIMDRFGVYDRVRAKGVTWSVGRVLDEAGEVYRFDLAQERLSKQPPFINCQQFYIEWFLAERLMEQPNAEVRWRHRVTGVTPRADHVSLTVETPEGSYATEASWLVDATGIASPIRDALGVRAASARHEDRWIILDVRFSKDFPRERWTWARAAFNDGRAVWQHPMADGVWRIDYQLGPETPVEEITSEEGIARRLRAHLGEDVGVEIVWVGPWGYRTHLLDSFRAGRTFFIGDAAHVFNPFGARGGNSGIQDAENLSWKLAAVLEGAAPESLLDTYDAERRAAAAHNIRTTARSIRFLAPRSPFEHALRDAVMGLARRHDFARRIVDMGRMSVAYDYADSPLTSSGSGSAFPNAAITLPDGTEGAVSDLLRGPGAKGLVIGGPGAVMPGGVSPRVRVVSVDPVSGLPRIAGPALEQLVGEGEVLVIRPDQHVAARLRRPDAGAVRAAVARAFGEDVMAEAA
ncbi:FAD-dependent oxidoreductase [Roseomonas sp. CCTCC AB2023176]|uniref:FAD-dependent oxidoreductase n=1 Tax=Roseomonas sp. CCTCC AB2023176 TaxID=3342640 RepID=UPI0035E1A111